MEIIRIRPEELKGLRIALRVIAGLLPSQKIPELKRMTPIQKEEAIAKWARELLEQHIQTQTALTRELTERVRQATMEAKEHELPLTKIRVVKEAMERARIRQGGIIGPEGKGEVIIMLPKAIKRELEELAKAMGRYARMAVPAELRTEIRVYSRAAEDLRGRVTKIRSLAQSLGIDPSIPEIALPIQQAEFMAADFEERVRQRQRWLEERGRRESAI